MTQLSAPMGPNAVQKRMALGGNFEVVVNLQGDAPLTLPWFIEDLVNGLKAAPDMGLATPVLRCDGATLNSLLQDRREGRLAAPLRFLPQITARYFSKEVIPYQSGAYEDVTTPLCFIMSAFMPTARRLQLIRIDGGAAGNT